MKRWQFLFGILFAAVLVFFIGGVGAKAYTSPTIANIESLGDEETVESFRSYLLEHFRECDTSIDIRSFNIPVGSKDVLMNFIFYCFPEAFHVKSSMRWSYNSEIITVIRPSYIEAFETKEEYRKAAILFHKNADALLKGVKGNSSLSDAEKALILHDRLILETAYDYDNYLSGTVPAESYTSYGVMVNRKGVCQGYSLAYSYLLAEADILTSYVSSDLLGHAWNIVYINGVPYHVDVTWDDPVPDRTGQVLHKNFLRSTAGIRSTGHEKNGAIDYNDAPTDTSYDGAFWQDIRASFVLAGKQLYYLTGEDATGRIKAVSGLSSTDVFSFTDRWSAGGSSYWIGIFSGFASDGNELFYNDSKALYALDPEKGTSKKIYEPDLSFSDTAAIYGFTYDKGTFSLLLDSGPNGSQNARTDVFVRPAIKVFSDFDSDGEVNVSDVRYLLYHLFFPEYYPVGPNPDLTGDGKLDLTDAVYLMYHTAFPELYPLVPYDDHSTEEDFFE